MLEGKLVNLRPLESNDLELVRAWRNTKESLKIFFSSIPISYEDQIHWFEKYLSSSDELMFIIENKKGKPVGTVGLVKIDHKNQNAELARVYTSERGKGYGFDASKTLLGYTFEELNMSRIYLEVFVDNTPAISLYEKLGFKKEGLKRKAIFKGGSFKDVLIMGLLREEYV